MQPYLSPIEEEEAQHEDPLLQSIMKTKSRYLEEDDEEEEEEFEEEEEEEQVEEPPPKPETKNDEIFVNTFSHLSPTEILQLWTRPELDGERIPVLSSSELEIRDAALKKRANNLAAGELAHIRNEKKMNADKEKELELAIRSRYFALLRSFRFSWIKPGMVVGIYSRLAPSHTIMTKDVVLNIAREYSYVLVISEQTQQSSSAYPLLGSWCPHFLQPCQVYPQMNETVMKRIVAISEKLLSNDNESEPSGPLPIMKSSTANILVVVEQSGWGGNVKLMASLCRLVNEKLKNVTLVLNMPVLNDVKSLDCVCQELSIAFLVQETSGAVLNQIGKNFDCPLIATKGSGAFSTLVQEFLRCSPLFLQSSPNFVEHALVLYSARRTLSLNEIQNSHKTDWYLSVFSHKIVSSNMFEQWLSENKEHLQLGWLAVRTTAQLVQKTAAAPIAKKGWSSFQLLPSPEIEDESEDNDTIPKKRGRKPKNKSK